MRSLVHVKAKSDAGKDRIKRHGDLFRITTYKDTVSFSDKPGPWVHIQSTYNRRQGWWINQFDDDDFNIIDTISVNVNG